MPPSVLVRAAGLAAFVLSGLLAPLGAQPCDVYPVRSGPTSQSLDGPWKFKYVAGSALGADAAFTGPGFAEAAWATIAVPGHWELQGFAEPQYGSVNDGTGLYRRTFRVPAAWGGQRVFLHFDGVLYGFEAWVNGRSVGTWASSYNPAAFDVTDALVPGADNLLAVRVTTRSHGWEFDTNDCWALSGIYREVTLFAVPPAYLTGFSATTKLRADGTADLHVIAESNRPEQVHGRLRAPDGRVVRDFQAATGAETVIAVEHPALWNAETPALYTLDLTLGSGQQASERIGLREVAIVNGVLQLNGTPLKLHGTDHHDIWPEHGRVATEALMRRDLALMRAANINFIRTSHYPPHPRFLELCDELGFYVMDEVPFGYGDEHLTDPGYQEDLLTRARATVRRDRNRPCVIVWSVGNENPNTPLTFATGRRVKELDPTRPICFPQVGSYFAKSYGELPDWVDIYAPHYPTLETVKKYAGQLTRPVIFTEYAHALGLATDRIADEWAVMQASPRLAGGAVWMFQDQGILRTSQKSAEEAGPDPYVWLDQHHYYDSNHLDGMDGIVYSDRTPSADYWQVRKVYSPVQIAEHRARVTPGLQTVVLHVANRYDFRPLAGLALGWSLQRNQATVQTGRVPLHAAAQATEEVALSVNVPADAAADVLALHLQCLDETGSSSYERTVALDLADAPTQTAVLLGALAPGDAPTLDEQPDRIAVRSATGELRLDRIGGGVSLRDPTGHVLVAEILPHAGRRLTEAEKLRAKKTSVWANTFLRDATALQTTARREADGVTVTVHARYVRPDAPDQALEGDLRLHVRKDGAIDIAYDYVPLNGKGTLPEAGLTLRAEAAAGEFRWIGAGPFAGYPGKEALNEFGVFHLNRADLNFTGNRRQVGVAVLSDPTGAGFAVAGAAMDVAVESEAAGVILSHNAVLSGRGNKGVGPETDLKAESTPHIAGSFTLVPLAGRWPAPLTAWFGPPTATVPVFKPFYRSYDQ